MNQSTITSTVLRGIRLFVATALLVLLAGLLPITQPVRASTYEVTNSNNSGPGSLRQAIDDANNSPGADTITFAPATDRNPIVLAGAPYEDGNASGDLDIFGGGDLTIQGNGAANTLIDGGGIDRVFHVCPGGCTNSVTFSGVTIRNGETMAYDGGGGGIFNSGTLTVDDSTISANTAEYGGGGIFNNSGTLTVDDSIISANTAQVGGGIYNSGTLNVQNGSTIGGVGAGNLATHGGGGIANWDGGMTTLNGSTVSANMSRYGGGINNNGRDVTLNVQNGSTITNNEAIDGGGGIFNVHGTTTVDGSTVSVNAAQAGGGIVNEYGTTTVDSSTISENDALNGGGIANFQGTTMVDGSTVSANKATNWGGGIYNLSTLVVQNGSIIGGDGLGNTAGEYGGGIYNYDGVTTVDGSTINANTAGEFGGGIYNFNGAATVDDSTVSDNMANSDGGGIYNRHTPIAQNGGTTTVSGSRIMNNTAANNGGGVYNDSSIGGATSVTGSCIVSNSAKSYLNGQPAMQIATGNWWGAATGPNTPGADTYGGDVDISGYLTAPILGCTPHLYLPVVLK